MNRVLASDVGGTKTNVAIHSASGPDLELVRRESFHGREHVSLEVALARLTERERDPVVAAGVGVAGPVVDGRVRTTNLPWHVEARRLAGTLSLDGVSLVNDVEAHAWSVPWLGAADRVTLQQRVLSGPGLARLHEFLRGQGPGSGAGGSGVPDGSGDPAASVARAALEEQDGLASHDHAGAETDPHAELPGDAMRGETFRFARDDYVEEAWRIVDPLLRDGRPLPYEPGSWGPAAADALVPGGWFAPARST